MAALAKRFVCIADESKLVTALGQFPLPVEVIPGRNVSCSSLLRWVARVRQKDGQPLVTDNGQHIIEDVTGLQITDPLRLKPTVSQWPGVVTVGVFAYQKASVCLLGAAQGVKT